MGTYNSNLSGLIHSFETCGTVDGPGIRFIAFLSGCSLRCKYCHNPDTSFISNGKTMTVQAVFDEISKYQGFLKSSHGGVTLSGGDPLFQIDFSKEILKACKSIGLHTAIDTSGALNNRVDDEYLSLIDLVLLDIKAGSQKTYHETTSGNLAPTLEFAKRLDQKNIPAWLRFVLVPGLTDNSEEIKSIANFAVELENFERVEILPFHKMGTYKWKELGLEDPLKETPEPTKDAIKSAREIFIAAGFPPDKVIAP